ncbi:nitroreductase family protein [Paraburkholderia lycopersici]|uniref:Nitroreductase n=1 Tax=Paraburkholderia lycopersici TaxID=416944 RepID=A0A1G6HAE3_9BURK|nr:Nitroreductase [Paraburkholderia lycopersici]
MTQPRKAEYDIAPIFTNRWSPRAFTGAAVDDETLYALFEAARWAPSANNAQPWRFIYARKDSASWPAVFGLLNENNQRWAANASVLIVLLSARTHVRPGSSEPSPLVSHSLDAGAAWASLAFQAYYAGLSAHAIGGFDRAKARIVLNVPEGYQVEVAIAVGKRADSSVLPRDLQEREWPTQRRPVNAFVAEGRFAFEDPGERG